MNNQFSHLEVVLKRMMAKIQEMTLPEQGYLYKDAYDIVLQEENLDLTLAEEKYLSERCASNYELEMEVCSELEQPCGKPLSAKED